jgi:hypothetical protein
MVPGVREAQISELLAHCRDSMGEAGAVDFVVADPHLDSTVAVMAAALAAGRMIGWRPDVVVQHWFAGVQQMVRPWMSEAGEDVPPPEGVGGEELGLWRRWRDLQVFGRPVPPDPPPGGAQPPESAPPSTISGPASAAGSPADWLGTAAGPTTAPPTTGTLPSQPGPGDDLGQPGADAEELRQGRRW